MTPPLGALVPSSPPSFLGLVAVASLVTILLYAERPGINARVVVSLVPWMVAGSALYVFSILVPYPETIRPLVGETGAYLSTYAILGGVWFGMLQLTTEREAVENVADYLGAMGFGVATVLVAFVILHGGAIVLERLVWLLVVPVAAGIAAFAVLVLFGFWYIDAPAHTGAAGALAVFGQAIEAVAVVLGVGAFDAVGHTFLSWKTLDWLVAVQAAELVGVDGMLVWAWAFIWVKIAVATVAVILLTPVARARPSLGHLLLGAIAAVGIVAGVTDLLTIAVGGLP